MAASKARKSTASGSAASYSQRGRRVKSELKRNSIDALLITRAQDIRYLTGFNGEDSYALATTNALHVISDFRFQEELTPLAGRAKVNVRTGPIAEAACNLIKSLKLKRVGVQSEYMTAATRAALASGLGARVLQDTQGVLAALRVIKDASEISAISKAAKIQEQALLAVLPLIRPGMTESLIAARLEFEMKVRGAAETSFHSIVAARANGSKPHYRPAATTTAKGQPLLIDWGAKFNGYCADMTRTFCLGKWPAKIRDVYEVVLEAQEAAIDAIAPGKTCGEIDAVARGIIEKAGYGPQFGHGLGHGIGLDVHENPRLARGTLTPLEPGMIVTVEPGVYLPGVGGVRIEDDILVTQRGRRNLSSLPKDLKWATLNG